MSLEHDKEIMETLISLYKISDHGRYFPTLNSPYTNYKHNLF